MRTIVPRLLTSTLASLALLGAGPPTQPPELLNASFDDDGTGVAEPSGWTSTGNVNADFTEASDAAGGFQLSHWSAESYVVDTTQTVTGVARGTYTLRARVRRSTGTNDSYLELDCGRRPARVWLPVAWPGQWVEVAVSARARGGSCTVTLHTEAAGGEWSNFDDVTLAPGRVRLSMLGADVSSLTKSEDLGGEYFYAEDDSSCRGPRRRARRDRPRSALRILRDHGANLGRVRVWVDPADGYHDLDEVVRMSRRLRRAGMDLLVDLHYSDFWADPGRQDKPAAWQDLSFDELEAAVYDHTYDVCTAVRDAAGAPALIQLGNELNSGMLWPDGHTWNPPNWDNLARLLSAGQAAVRDCSSETRTVLHLANGGDNGAFQWWFDNISSRGVEIDVIGASYYGYWHGSLGDLQANLNDVSARYDADVLVVETAYPFTLDFEDDESNVIGLPEQLVAGYPATPEGQARNFRDVLSVVRAVPEGRGLGAVYWDATWTAVEGNGWDPTNPASGNSWENQALFDFDDRALPAMSEYRR